MILNSTFFVISPSSKPKYISSEKTLSDGEIEDVIPVQPKNWFIVFSLYEIVLIPDKTVPLKGNPMVESTVTTEEPIDILSTDLLLGVILKSPSTRDAPPYPIKSENL